MHYWNSRKLPSIGDDALTQAHVDQARRAAEDAHDELLRLVDPKHPRHENFFRGAPLRQRQIAEAQELADLRRTEWKMLEERWETKLRRQRAAREEQLHQRNVAAAEAAAKEAARQSALAQRQAPAALNRRTEEPMTDQARLVQQRDALRFALLKRMWERSKADTSVVMERRSLFAEVSANEKDGEAAARWLVDKGLAGIMGDYLKIEHAGIEEVEDAIRDPQSRTEHFSPPVISMANTFNIHGSTLGALQIGNDATANVQQNIGAMPKDLVELFVQLRRAVDALPDEDQRIEIAEVVNDLETEAKKEKRNEFRLKMLATGLTAVTTLTPIVKMILGVLGVHIAT